MTAEDDFGEHQRTWVGFTKLITYCTIAVVITLAVMALTLI